MLNITEAERRRIKAKMEADQRREDKKCADELIKLLEEGPCVYDPKRGLGFALDMDSETGVLQQVSDQYKQWAAKRVIPKVKRLLRNRPTA